jgi:hypothetical protein
MTDENSEKVEKLLAMPELGEALESGRFKRFLDHLPIAIVVAEPKGSHEWIITPIVSSPGSAPGPYCGGWPPLECSRLSYLRSEPASPARASGCERDRTAASNRLRDGSSSSVPPAGSGGRELRRVTTTRRPLTTSS